MKTNQNISNSGGSNSNNPQLVNVKVKIPKVDCASCVFVIERKFKKMAGISASVNFITKTVFLELDPNLWNEQTVLEVFKKIGYAAVDWEIVK